MNVSQFVVNVLLTTSWMVLVGLGFSLVYGVTRFFNLACAFLFSVGPYCVFLLSSKLGIVPAVAVPLAIVAVGVVGGCLDISVFRPLRHKHASPLVLLLSSLGVYVILQNALSLFFGDESISIPCGPIGPGNIILGARVTSVQLLTIGLSVVAVTATAIFLKCTRIGLSIRAISSSPELASVSGIQNDRVIFSTTFISSALLGTAGILMAIDVYINPTTGMNALMMGIIACIVGGRGNILGIVCGALLISTAQHLGAWHVGSQWQDAIAFGILLAFLLFKPEGFMGKKVREATV